MWANAEVGAGVVLSLLKAVFSRVGLNVVLGVVLGFSLMMILAGTNVFVTLALIGGISFYFYGRIRKYRRVKAENKEYKER